MIHKNRIIVQLILVVSLIFLQAAISYADTKEEIVNWLASTQNPDATWDSINPRLEGITLATTVDIKDQEEDLNALSKRNLMYSFNNTLKIAGKFIPQEKYLCTKVVLPLSTDSYGDNPEGSIYVYLCTEYNGTPSDNIIASSSEISLGSNNPIGISRTYIEFNFTQEVELESGKTYYIVLAPGQGGLIDNHPYYNMIGWHYKDLIDAGNAQYLNGSNVWSVLNDCVLLYTIYGKGYEITTSNCINESPFATLAVTKALLDSNVDNTALNNALAYAENQEFFNTEYLSRQIEILSLAGKDCSVYIDKLLSFLNNDGGWGECLGYKSNPVDTVWALKALLVSGYKDDFIIKNALELLIAYTSKVLGTDSFKWSIFYPTYCSENSSWKSRVDSSIISAYILDLLISNSAYFAQIVLTNENFSSLDAVKTELINFLDDKLTEYNAGIEEHILEASIMAAVLIKCGYDETNQSPSSTLSAINGELESDEGMTQYKQDPYLTSMILTLLAAEPLTTINFSLTFTPENDTDDDTITVTFTDITDVNLLQFYIKSSNSDHFIEIYDNDEVTEAINAYDGYDVQNGDTIKAVVNGIYSKELQYYEKDIAIYNQGMSLCSVDQNDQEYPLTTYIINQTTSASTIRIKQKIFNNTPVYQNITMRYSYQDGTGTYEFTKNIEIPPSSQQLNTYSFDIENVPTNSCGNIAITLEVVDSINEHDETTIELHVISGDGTATNSNLSAPLFPDANIVGIEGDGSEKVLISWQAPLDPNVVAYKVIRVPGVLEGITTSTSLECNIYETGTTYYIYSIDENNAYSEEYASITVSYDDDKIKPKIDITYPQNNEIIRFFEDSDSYSNSVIQFDIKGTIENIVGDDRIKIEITARNDATDKKITINYPNSYLFPEEGLIYRISQNTDGCENLTTGNYDLIINAVGKIIDPLTIPPTRLTEQKTIPIQIQKWNKAGLVGDNNSSHPSWDISGSNITFVSDELFDSSGTQTYFKQIWQINNYLGFDTLVNTYQNANATIDITSLSSGMTNYLEPSWVSYDSLMYIAYGNGNRNIHFYNTSTSTDIGLEVIIDIDGNQVSGDFNPLLHTKKSFYNPDAVQYSSANDTCIVASDEYGELVMVLRDQAGNYDLYNLTRDLTLDEGKDFILADNPSVFLDTTTNIANILFEGYSVTIPDNLQNNDYYYNSDIFLLTLDLDDLPNNETPQLYKITQTPNESELSPIWLCDGQTDAFLNVNIAFSTYTDFWGEGEQQSTIQVGQLANLSTSPELINSYAIAPQGAFEGYIQNIDVNNYYFLFDELLYDGENTDSSYRSRIGYVKLDSDIHDAFIISTENNLQSPIPIPTQITISTSPTSINIIRHRMVTLTSATFDNDIYDSTLPESFSSAEISQLIDPGVILTWELSYPNAGTYTAEFVFILDNGLQFTKKFTVIVTE